MNKPHGEHAEPLASTETSLAQSERISLLNHDIRAAMSDVIGGLRLVDPDTLSVETRTQIDRVRSSGEVLARLLEEALSFMDAASPLEPVRTNLNLERFLHDLDLRWRGRAKAHGVRFTLTIAEDVPRVICTDRMALDRIFANLLSNALKYAGPKGVEMRINLTEDGALCATIQDDGPGFSASALAHLFEYEGRPSDSSQPGTGLGLRIAKELTDTIHGTLSVCNRDHGGALASFHLPRTAWELASPVAVATDLPNLSGCKVLVADDNETNQLLTSQMLAIMGAEHEIAPDGVEALNWLEREDFDVALIDIEMPRLNGIEVIRAFRAKPGPSAHMPMIALTAYVLKTNRDAIFHAGADGIIAKPILDIATFGEAIATHLETAKRTGDDFPELLIPPIDDLDRVDCKRMEELLKIAGPGASIELLDRLIGDLSRVRTHLLFASPISGHGKIRAESHVLISLSGAIGAQGLLQLAKSLNAAAHRNHSAVLPELTQRTAHALSGILARLRTKREGLVTS